MAPTWLNQLGRGQTVREAGTRGPAVSGADGESQSANRLVTYYNAIHRLARAYDGFLIHSTGNGGALVTVPVTFLQPATVSRDSVRLSEFGDCETARPNCC